MIVTLGYSALILALLISMAQAVVPLLGAHRNDGNLMHTARPLAYSAFLLVLAAFFALVYAHVSDDFSVLNVVMNSHTHKPMLYKITGAWASHEGSMVLWILTLTGFGAAMALNAPTMPLALRARALAVQGMIGFGFLSFILLTSDPFKRVTSSVIEGNDLNPLLQDPGLAFHPPFLYIGYVGFSSVFAFAAALLLSPNADASMTKWLRPWALVAWSSLTFGIAMGSWWAYYELGWGGWWFWDPVENAALMPWLSGTALVHCLLASSKRGVLMRWTILLSIITFGFSLLGTFLVRSGILTSVHSFAVDSERGVFVLGLLAIAIGGALTLYAYRSAHLPDSPLFALVSRETALLLNNLFLCTACATLLTGTLYPLLLDAFGGGLISVGAPYFNAAVVPLLLPLLGLMVIGPLLRWQQSELGIVLRALKTAALFALIAFAVSLYFLGYQSILGAFAALFGVWILCGTLTQAKTHCSAWRTQLPQWLAHGGMGILVLGMAGSSFSQQHSFVIAPHQTVDVAGYHVTLEDLQNVQGPNYQAARGLFHIIHNGTTYTLKPEHRYYPVQESVISNVAIETNLMRDLYLALGEEQMDSKGVAVRNVRFHINPLVPWIWIGATIMAAGGLAGLFLRRDRT